MGQVDETGGKAHELFSGLLCAGRYDEAFKLGETLLDRFRRLPMPQNLLWPWWLRTKRETADARFLKAEWRRLGDAARSGRFPHWFAYCRGILLLKMGRQRQSLAEYERIRRRNAARYDFMRQPFVVSRLACDEGSADWVIETGRTLLRREPGLWELRCRMAEGLLARGDRGRGLAEFARAARSSEASARPAIQAWHGEALLWLGRYRAALGQLDAAVAAGARYARAWRGAVYVKLGRRDALAELDEAQRLDAGDPEIPLWKGEACRVAGRFAGALEELGRAIRSGFHWGLYNRALVWHDLGRMDAMGEDFASIPRKETDFLRGELGLPRRRELTVAQMRAILEAGLSRAKGVRRSEAFLRPLWMR